MKLLNLKCEGVKLWGDKYIEQRMKNVLKFIRKHIDINKITWILDIGERNKMGVTIAENLKTECFFTGQRDLDFPWGNSNSAFTPQLVICLEVLEHLMNPLICLLEIKKIITYETDIIVSVPRRPKIAWQSYHFHEFSANAFYTMIDKAGFKIIHHTSFNMGHHWWFYFTGFRPLFVRLPLRLFGLNRDHIYHLRLK